VKTSSFQHGLNLHAIFCEETGLFPVAGACPFHKGDACLVSVEHYKVRLRESLQREEALRTKLLDYRLSAPGGGGPSGEATDG
jgi:hypothetical protein